MFSTDTTLALKNYIVGVRDEMNAFIQGAIPFRMKWIERTNHLESKLMFGMLHSNQVLQGKDGWLFYSKVSDGNPIGHYVGESLYSRNDENAILDGLNTIDAECQRLGIKFSVFVPPSKEIIYSEFMPRYIRRISTIPPTQKMIDYIHAHSTINIHYMLSYLDSVKQHAPYPLYLKYDTHWNNYGAFFGLKYITDALGYENCIQGFTYAVDSHPKLLDLAGIINMSWDQMDQFDCRISNYYSNDSAFKMIRNEFDFLNNVDSRHIFVWRNPTAPNKTRLLMIHDSFGEYFYPYIRHLFSETIMIHKRWFKNEFIQQFKPNVIVWQCIERNLGIDVKWIRNFGAYMKTLTPDALR